MAFDQDDVVASFEGLRGAMQSVLDDLSAKLERASYYEYQYLRQLIATVQNDILDHSMGKVAKELRIQKGVV